MRHHIRTPAAILIDQSRRAEGVGMEAKAGSNSDDTQSRDVQISAGIPSSVNGHERAEDGLKINVQLAEDTGRKLGPAVLVTGGIGRHGGSQGVTTTPCASKPPPDMLAAATNRPTAAATNNDRGIVKRVEVITGGGSRIHNTYPNAKKLSTLAVALAMGRLSKSCSTPPSLPAGSPSRGQSGSSHLTVQHNVFMERSGSGSSHPGEHNKVEEGVGVASSSCGEETGAGGMKRRRSYGLVNEGRALPKHYSSSDVKSSGEVASFGYSKVSP